MLTGPLLAHLRAAAPPLRLARRRPLAWDDEPQHQAFYAEDPELYGLCALAQGVHPAQRARALLQILRASRKGLGHDAAVSLDRVVALLLALVPVDDVLTVFLALRRGRANHRHASRAILRYVFHHPAAESLLACRRASLAACVEHAIGGPTARGAAPAREPTPPPQPPPQPRAEGEQESRDGAEAQAPVREAGEGPQRAGSPQGGARPLLPLRGLPDRASERSQALWKALFSAPTERRPLDREARRKASASHARYLAALDPPRDYPKTINATNRGDVAATLVHLYRGGDSGYLRRALDDFIDKAASSLPRLEGTIALVLDASQSTRGYGEREFCCISQSVALARVLARCCPGLRTYQVGGVGEPPQPQGASDLASALLRALGEGPDVVLLVSDGYESRLDGDLASVIAALPGAGVRTPVLFAHSKFTAKDDLSLRRPAPQLPSLEFWHEDDFATILASIAAHLPGGQGDALLRKQLLDRLSHLEHELKPWTTPSSTPALC